MSDRDNRRRDDKLHPDDAATWDDDVTPVGKPSRRPRRAVTPPPVALTASGEIDCADIVAAVDRDMPEHFRRLVDRIEAAERAVAACAAAEARREKWKVWKRVGGGVSLGSIIVAAGFVARALLSAGEAANAARAETEALRDVVSRTREIEKVQSGHDALIDALTRVVFAPRNQ